MWAKCCLANFWHFYRPATLWVDIAFIYNLRRQFISVSPNIA